MSRTMTVTGAEPDDEGCLPRHQREEALAAQAQLTEKDWKLLVQMEGARASEWSTRIYRAEKFRSLYRAGYLAVSPVGNTRNSEYQVSDAGRDALEERAASAEGRPFFPRWCLVRWKGRMARYCGRTQTPGEVSITLLEGQGEHRRAVGQQLVHESELSFVESLP